MTAEYAVGLLGLVGSLGGIIALVWAIRHRQLRAGDEAMYEAVADDEPDYTGDTPAPRIRFVAWSFVAALTLIFLLVGWLIVQTVRIGTHAAPLPPAQRQPLNTE